MHYVYVWVLELFRLWGLAVSLYCYDLEGDIREQVISISPSPSMNYALPLSAAFMYSLVTGPSQQLTDKGLQLSNLYYEST